MLRHGIELMGFLTTAVALHARQEAKRWRAAAAEAEEREAEWSAGNQPTEFAPDFEKLQQLGYV